MRTILLADDEANLRLLVRTTLEAPGHRILEAASGKEALDMARKEVPDLILLDWMMPDSSGIEVLCSLRKDPSTAAVPVIMLTAKAQKNDREAAVDAGADDYLTKPFSPLELLAAVERFVVDKLREE